MTEQELDASVGSIVRRYEAILKEIALLRSSLADTGQRLIQLGGELTTAPDETNVGEIAKVTALGETAIKKVQDLRKAGDEKGSLQACLREVGLARLIAP